MKKVLIMATVTLFARLLAAEQVDVKSLLGEDWYGIYMQGQKAGYSVNSVKQSADGRVVVTEDATFRVSMAGIQQDMRMYLNRVYAPDGSLLSIEQYVQDVSGKSEFNALVEGDKLLMTTVIGGQSSQMTLPKPKESLTDALKQAELIKGQPEIGKEISFVTFEPMLGKELSGSSRIDGVEQRVFEGAQTKVYRIKSRIDQPNLEMTTYVNEQGTVLEDQFAGMLVMRLEPEQVAKDVDYSNDVIISNAVPISGIEDPRERPELNLTIKGPVTKDNLINDDRQSMAMNGGNVEFTGRKLDLSNFRAAQLPIEDPEVKEWQQPTMLVQSADPRMVAKAKEIVGDEKDALAISTRLSKWVYENVRTTYSARLSNSLEVLENPRGDCTEHSMLFIGLARAAGLPAREAAGLIYVDDDKPGFYFHQWASVWVGRWIDVDPTFDQPIADATHVKLAVGDLYEQARLIPVIGRLSISLREKPAQ